MFTETPKLDGEMGTTDWITKPWKTADSYIEGSLAEVFVYVFASERVARVELTPGCRHIQALS